MCKSEIISQICTQHSFFSIDSNECCSILTLHITTQVAKASHQPLFIVRLGHPSSYFYFISLEIRKLHRFLRQPKQHREIMRHGKKHQNARYKITGFLKVRASFK